MQLDVTDPVALAAAAERIAAELGAPTALVNAAGVYPPTHARDPTVELYRRVFDSNVLGTVLATQAFAPRMADGGAIVNFSSINAFTPSAGQLLYSAAKAAIVQLTKSLAIELGPRLRVNALAPGWVDTPGTRANERLRGGDPRGIPLQPGRVAGGDGRPGVPAGGRGACAVRHRRDGGGERRPRVPLMSAPRYCIVGAGATGLASIEALRDAGIEFDCFEQDDRIGGQWHTGYEALHLITPRDCSGFTGYPMPANYPLYPSRDQMRDYLLDFAAARDLVRHVTFQTRVEKIAPEGRDWLVETGDGETRRYAGVIVANGHLRVPLQPDLPGYTGRQLHAATYQSTADIEGTRVLVVGSGNSGCDIAVDCAQRPGLATTISIRKGHLFQPKTFAGKPRGELWIMRLPPRLQDTRCGR